MHLMLTTLPPHPASFPPKRGLACSATLHHTPVGPSVCTEAGCRLTLLVPPRLHRQLIYTYGSSPHDLTTFRFRHWLSSTPTPPPEASSAFSSSAFSTSRRSFLPPPVPLLHYFSRLCARTTLPRLGSPNHLDTPWVALRLGLDPQYESSLPPSRSFAGGRLLPPSLLTHA
jgi:hypothetical protein